MFKDRLEISADIVEKTIVSYLRDFGDIDFYILPYFREQIFPGANGRPRLKLEIDENSILIIRGCGPVGYPGSAEVVNMQPPDKLLKNGTIGSPNNSFTSAKMRPQ